MKKLVIILLCAVATMSFTIDKRKTVKADGPIVKKERSIGNFTGIDTSAGIDVYITQGNGPKLSVKTEENLHEYIMTEVRGDVLHVFTKVNIRDSKSKKVYVTMDEVISLEASSAGDIIGETQIQTDELKLDASSAGDIKLEVVANTILADCSSAGDIKLSGKAKYLKADASSAGDFIAGDLKVREAKVSASSSGDILVNVSEKLEASASSSGDVRYYGDPKVDSSSSSSGCVKKK